MTFNYISCIFYGIYFQSCNTITYTLWWSCSPRAPSVRPPSDATTRHVTYLWQNLPVSQPRSLYARGCRWWWVGGVGSITGHLLQRKPHVHMSHHKPPHLVTPFTQLIHYLKYQITSLKLFHNLCTLITCLFGIFLRFSINLKFPVSRWKTGHFWSTDSPHLVSTAYTGQFKITYPTQVPFIDLVLWYWDWWKLLIVAIISVGDEVY